jgi:hypothetical protein
MFINHLTHAQLRRGEIGNGSSGLQTSDNASCSGIRNELDQNHLTAIRFNEIPPDHPIDAVVRALDKDIRPDVESVLGELSG